MARPGHRLSADDAAVRRLLRVDGELHSSGHARQAALGLRVTTLDSLRSSGRTALLRTVGKLLPWELAHTAVHQISAAERSQASTPLWAMVLAFVAIAAAVGYVECLFTPSHRTPYDRWSNTRVVRSAA